MEDEAMIFSWIKSVISAIQYLCVQQTVDYLPVTFGDNSSLPNRDRPFLATITVGCCAQIFSNLLNPLTLFVKFEAC